MKSTPQRETRSKSTAGPIRLSRPRTKPVIGRATCGASRNCGAIIHIIRRTGICITIIPGGTIAILICTTLTEGVRNIIITMDHAGGADIIPTEAIIIMDRAGAAQGVHHR